MNGVTVTFKYLVNFSDKTGKSREDVSFEAGADLNTVSAWLKETYDVQAPEKGMLNLLNGHSWHQYQDKMETKLKDGDVIIIMPSISGG